ncbi:adenine phosphoribosyltransferase [Dokdonella immobilis]|uniref:Adenine phosphoribosyltransferase n=1 Tax=Dokdonella immobilis TaxID=578942 RepID=A0A1I4Z4M2_9GAMM|nr:adenine phosphoribosyltransferase [Dokdonella immobilis]SFN45148.1 adenine phosphoribosyltransferase [Dokdonella immobilis]
MSIAHWVRDIEDFPRAGVGFKDLTPLLANAGPFAESIRLLAAPFRDQRVDCVCGIEARGFIFGAAVATALGCGFVPLRKPGKLPAAKIGIDYALEYGTDRLEMHADAVCPGTRVLIVDDVLATGGTLAAAGELVARTEAEIVGAAVVIEIAALAGRTRWLWPAPLHALIVYGQD